MADAALDWLNSPAGRGLEAAAIGEVLVSLSAGLDALGQSPQDSRSEGQRFHDALQLGCELLIRAKMIPAQAGAGHRA